MKITELKAGEEYAARLYPKSPDLVSRIRLLDTNKTVRRSYSEGWSGTKRTTAMPAVSIQRDGRESAVHEGVLPKHIFATWEEYRPTAEAAWAEKDRRELFTLQADEQFTVIDEGSYVVVRWTPTEGDADPLDLVRFMLTGRIVDREMATKQADDFMRVAKSRFIRLAMGTLEGVNA